MKRNKHGPLRWFIKKSKYRFNKLEGTLILFNTQCRDGVRKEGKEGERVGGALRGRREMDGRSHHLLYSKHMSE